MAMRRFKPIIMGMSFLLTLSIGCESRGPWAVERVDGPWNGPQSQSRQFVRNVVPPFFVPADESQERAWETLQKRKISCDRVAKDIDSYCEKLPEFRQWHTLQSFVDGQQLRFAPAKFWVVSIDPTVVVMVPFTVDPDGKSNQELSGAVNLLALLSSVLVNEYNFGTEIEAASMICWFRVGG